VWVLSFDGVDDKVKCGANASLDITTAGSLLVWTLYRSWTDVYGVIAGKAGADYPYYIFAQDNTYTGGLPMFLANIKDSVGYKQIELGVPTEGKVYSLGLTWDSTTVKGYRNGLLVSSTPGGAALSFPGTEFSIGGKSTDTTRDYKGDIYSVQLLNRAIPAQEILRMHISAQWKYQ
jgi:hypothetical protein